MLRVIGLKKEKIGEYASYEEFAKFVNSSIFGQNVSRNESFKDIYREGCIDYRKPRHPKICEFTLYKNPRVSLNPPKKPTHRSNFLSKRAYYAD